MIHAGERVGRIGINNEFYGFLESHSIIINEVCLAAQLMVINLSPPILCLIHI